MKAVVEGDIIRHITEKGDTEIGVIPPDKKGVGLERLRFDGAKIVDLADLAELWVERLGAEFFELHAVELPGTQNIAMTYADRKSLTIENGIIRLKTAQEILDGIKAEKIAQIKHRLAAKQKRDIGDLEERLLNAYKLILALIVYARQQPQLLADFFDLLIPHIKDAFPLDRVKDELIEAAQSLKGLMDEYYQEIDKI